MLILSCSTGIEDLFADATRIMECNDKQSASKAYYSIVNLTYSDERNNLSAGKMIANSFLM